MEGFKDIPPLPYGRLPSLVPLRVIPQRGPELAEAHERRPDENLIRNAIKDPEAGDRSPKAERERTQERESSRPSRDERLEQAREQREQRRAERAARLDIEG